MLMDIDEPIKVAAVFCRGEIKPVWFSRYGTQLRIREVAFTWQTLQGSARILHFSVSDGQGLYEVCFNTENMEWRLVNAEGI